MIKTTPMPKMTDGTTTANIAIAPPRITESVLICARFELPPQRGRFGLGAAVEQKQRHGRIIDHRAVIRHDVDSNDRLHATRSSHRECFIYVREVNGVNTVGTKCNPSSVKTAPSKV
jgi:hypothetical protein